MAAPQPKFSPVFLPLLLHHLQQELLQSPPPRPQPGRRTALPRRCGHCLQPGHTQRTCPQLGRAAPDFNRNAIDVQPLAAYARVSAYVGGNVAEAPHQSPVQPAAPASAVARSDDEDSRSDASWGSQSQDDNDDEVVNGFDGSAWRCIYDSTMPVAGGNALESPSTPLRRPRRSESAASSGSSSDDQLVGSPSFNRPQVPEGYPVSARLLVSLSSCCSPTPSSTLL